MTIRNKNYRRLPKFFSQPYPGMNKPAKILPLEIKPAMVQLEARAGASKAAPKAPSQVPMRKLPLAVRVDDGMDDFDIPCGMVRRQVGDVILFNHFEYVITRVGVGSATARCLSKSIKTIKSSRTGESKDIEFDSASTIRICNTCEPANIVRRLIDYCII